VALVLTARSQRSNHTTSEAMTQEKMTICVGRFLIDLPKGAKVIFAATRVAGVTISMEEGSSDMGLKTAIAEREQELNQQTNEYGQRSLEKKNEVDAVNFKTTLIYYGREKPMKPIVYGEQVFGGVERLNVEAFGLYADRLYRFKGEHLASPLTENNVAELAMQFESREQETIPAEAGFCTDSGFIHDPIAPGDVESIAMFASLRGYPDLSIRLDISVNGKKIHESLLSRAANNGIRREFISRFTNLRKQARVVNGIAGEEFGEHVKEFNGTSAHMFTWASMGKLKDVTAPKITLELQTGIGRPGAPVNASLSDDAVIALWDSIASSIRLRPTSPAAKISQAPSPQSAPLGQLAASGQSCPHTGYWACNEAGEVEGGQRQFFKEGAAIPMAILRGTPSLWQRLNGTAPLHRVSTVWKLVGFAPQASHADEPSHAGASRGTDKSTPDANRDEA